MATDFKITRQTFLLAAIGLGAGFFAGLFGLGGGVLIVPALVFLAGFNQRQAAATSALALVPAAFVGSLGYLLQGKVSVLAALALAIGVACGAKLGTRLLPKLSLRVLETLFFVFLIFAIVTLWLKIPDRNAVFEIDFGSFFLLILFGFLPGLAMTLLGVGGGIIAIPGLISGFGMSDLLAKGTSLSMILVGALTSAPRNIKAKIASFPAAITVGISAVVTVPLGALCAFLTPALIANILFTVFLSVIAAQYLRKILRSK